jgi:hypothetical protein
MKNNRLRRNIQKKEKYEKIAIESKRQRKGERGGEQFPVIFGTFTLYIRYLC